MVMTLTPDPQMLPRVLPTERLLVNGFAIPEIRARYRKIPNFRNVRAVVMVWFWTLSLMWLGTHSGVVGLIVVVILMGPMHARFAILMHEAAHKLLFTKKQWNDIVGRWIIAYPAFVPIELYRRGHFAHHKDEFGPDEPDIPFYDGYPCGPEDLRRRLLRDAIGISGWKNFRVLVSALTKKNSRPLAGRIWLSQLAMAALAWAITGRWWAWIVFWWLPWMTQWRVLNRLRAIAEHGGMQRSDDRRLTTHHVRQSLIARFWFVPYHTGWHLAHHVDMGVPWTQLPAFQRELEDAGYITRDITFRNYRELWRAATAGTGE